MDMSSDSTPTRWYEPPRSSLESAGPGGAGVPGVNPDYRSYYPHPAPTPHHPSATAHYAHISVGVLRRENTRWLAALGRHLVQMYTATEGGAKRRLVNGSSQLQPRIREL
ncbi:hypothetical protein KQX54_017692 [Cotesia glomerata]|uniref:Uncharacterized protein n=1 Tax=Cotesia glomerata TaxID=32391 RepID=A0AAV7IEH0_COTGL|nr:hypothetical protein KQX54_017692 [Cotesia glomerata]